MKTNAMNLLTWVLVSVILFGIVLLWNSKALGQEWTAEQKEIWEVVKADVKKFKQGDVEGISASRHEDVIIWWGSEPMPFDKKMAIYRYNRWIKYDKPDMWEVEPLAIKIVGKVASVFFTYKFSGNITSDSGKELETWIKQDNKWILINSLGASCDKLPPCK